MSDGWLSDADRSHLLDHADGERDRLILRLYIETKLELDEIGALREDCLSTETIGDATNYWVSTTSTEERSSRKVWVPPELWQTLEAWRDDRVEEGEEEGESYLFANGEPVAASALESRLADVLERAREETQREGFESASVADLKLAYYDDLVKEKYQYDP